MRLALPVDLADVDEPKVRLVDEFRRVHRVPRALVTHVATGEAAEFLVNQRKEIVRRSGLPLRERDQSPSRNTRLATQDNLPPG